MRRSLYQRTFLKGSTLYRQDLQRRPSTLPPHVQQQQTVNLGVPSVYQQGSRARCPMTRFSCPEEPCDRVVGIAARRPYCSTTDDSLPDFPLRIKKDLSADTFRQTSHDSESSGSYLSPRSHRSVSYQAEDIEMDVFSKQSSQTSEEFQNLYQKSERRVRSRSERILSFQETRKKDSTDTNDETWKTCASVEECVKSEPINDLYSRKMSGEDKSRDTTSWEESGESGSSLSKSVIDVSQGEQSESRINRKVYELLESEKGSGEFKGKQLPDTPYSREFFKWNTSSYDDYDPDNLAVSKEAGISFKVDLFSATDVMSDSAEFNVSRGLFPGKKHQKKADTMGIHDRVSKSQSEERDEGFDSPVYGSRDADELSDLFGAGQEMSRREMFRKERSLDSDETSGFISKHSSETTDLSSRLSSTNFSTKHSSEPLGFGTAGTPTEFPHQQHLSEPQHLAAPTPVSDSGFKKLLNVEHDSESQTYGAMSKRREHFRKSKRLKHFNLRRIDDTDNDSSCDSERPPVSADDVAEPPSTRLKEEVGLPKHLSRDSSVDRYGLYKSRSEKTITSFESDRGANARLHDFESFCEAVNFGQTHASRQRAVSADEIELSDLEDAPPSPRTPPRLLRRKSRSKRNLARRLKCLLL